MQKKNLFYYPASEKNSEDFKKHGSEAMPLKPKSKPLSKARKTKALVMPSLYKCIDSKCCYAKSRHRRYYWFSKTKLAKPSCPKCFSHNTVKVSSEEAKKLGV
jgi:hypothetical protein